MNWMIIIVVGAVLVVVYLNWTLASNQREARRFFNMGWKRGVAGEKPTDDEMVFQAMNWDVLQRSAFQAGYSEAIADPDSSPDDAFDYDWIVRSAKREYENPMRKHLGIR